MKKLTIAVTLSAGLFGLAACSSDASDSEIVAKTNVGDITKDEFYEELKDLAGESVLQNLIFTQVLEDEYGEVSESDIDDKIQEFKDQYGEQYPMWLQQQGIEDDESEDFRAQVSFVVLQEKAMYDGIEVTDEEIEEKFNEMKENDEIEIEASHILVDDEDEAEDIKKQLDDGADFAELAEEHSNDGSAENGGDLGFFPPAQMVPEFSEAALELDIDEISDPVESEFGYHIIKLTGIAELEDMEDDIRLEIRNEKATENQAETAERIDNLLKDADIDIKIDECKDLFKFEDSESEPDNEDNANNDNNNNENNNDDNTSDENSNDKANNENNSN